MTRRQFCVFSPWSQGARYARSDASSECGLGVAGNGAFRAYSHGSSIVAACGGIGGPCANAPWVCPMKKLEPARSEPADLRRINTGGLPAYRAVCFTSSSNVHSSGFP